MTSTDPTDLALAVKQAAYSVGFDVAALAPYRAPVSAPLLTRWLGKGHHGEMAWMAKRPARRMDPRIHWPEGRSLLSVGMSYHQARPPHAPDPTDPSRGRFARYAWGLDYHDLFDKRLKVLRRAIDYLAGREVAAIWSCDTGPVLERSHAVAAGHGFQGKHTLLIHPVHGSYLLLGELLLDLELPPDKPRREHFGCRGCTRCSDICPTGALDEPYVNHADRCLSYLTIELRGPIPRELRPKLGNWVFGCDLCQETCPYNARLLPDSDEPHFQPHVPDWGAPRLLDLIELDDAGFRAMFKGSAVKRTKRRGLLRNVAVALGNWGSDEAIPALRRVMETEPEPLIRSHAAWALGRLGDYAAARETLFRAWRTEQDDQVRDELATALEGRP